MQKMGIACEAGLSVERTHQVKAAAIPTGLQNSKILETIAKKTEISVIPELLRSSSTRISSTLQSLRRGWSTRACSKPINVELEPLLLGAMTSVSATSLSPPWRATQP